MDLAALHLEIAPLLPAIGGTIGAAVLLYLAVTTLYIATALVVNRVMARIEKRIRIPGTVGGDK